MKMMRSFIFGLSVLGISLTGCAMAKREKGGQDSAGQNASLPSEFTKTYTVEFYIYKSSEEGKKPTQSWKVYEINNVPYLSKIDRPTKDQLEIPTEIYEENCDIGGWSTYDKNDLIDGTWMFTAFLVTEDLQLYGYYGM